MLKVFADAGLPVRRTLIDGDVQLTFPLPCDEADRSLDSYLDSVAARESRADVASLRHLLQPASIAVIGASRRRGSPGREILHNIVTGGFAGPVYAVNPRGQSMEGLHCLPSVADLPEDVDLAVIAVPAPAVPGVAAECGRRGVRSLVVITSGLGPAGADLLADLPQARHAAGGPELLRHRRARPRPGRDLRREPPPSRRRRAGGPVRRSGRVAPRASVPARYRRVLVRLGRRQVRRVQQ